MQPGHVFPLVAQRGGVLARAGHTEAGCDLAALAGLTPAAVICEIMKDDGTMARLPDLVEFAREHGLKIGTIADLIHYRSQTERLIERVGERPIRTAAGRLRLVDFRDKLTDATHLALVRGDDRAGARDAGARARAAVGPRPARLRQPRRTPGRCRRRWRRSRAPSAACWCCCTGPNRRRTCATARSPTSRASRRKMDLRNYGIGAQILRDLGVGKMRLLARPRKMPSMAGFDLEVTGYENCRSLAPSL